MKFNLYKHESTSLYNIFIIFVSDDSTSNLRVRIINKDFHPSGKKDENKIIIKKKQYNINNNNKKTKR